MSKQSKKGYWYEFFWIECPVCGRSSSYKERRYTKKPKDPEKRHHYEQVYDWCDAL